MKEEEYLKLFLTLRRYPQVCLTDPQETQKHKEETLKNTNHPLAKEGLRKLRENRRLKDKELIEHEARRLTPEKFR